LHSAFILLNDGHHKMAGSFGGASDPDHLIVHSTSSYFLNGAGVQDVIK
jgi:hypothetical protein